MILAADASVLVGELLRKRGRELLLHPDLRVLVAEQQWEEAEHELSRRLSILESQELVIVPLDRRPRPISSDSPSSASSKCTAFA